MKLLDALEKRPALPIIVMLGAIWVMGGTLNIMDVNAPGGGERYAALVGHVWADGLEVGLPVGSTLYLPERIPPNPVPGMAAFLRDFVAPNAYAFMMTMAVLEILVGLSILTGFLTRFAPVVGVGMNLSILLASGHTHPGLLRVNLLMAAAGLTVLLVRRAQAYGVDLWLQRRHGDSRVIKALCA